MSCAKDKRRKLAAMTGMRSALQYSDCGCGQSGSPCHWGVGWFQSLAQYLSDFCLLPALR